MMHPHLNALITEEAIFNAVRDSDKITAMQDKKARKAYENVYNISRSILLF